MRCDGRLIYAEFLSYDVRFPVILPRRSRVTKLIVKQYHEQCHHASGTKQTLSALSARYWIISGREVIREWEKECAECRRRKAKACKQIMAPLPTIRLKPSCRPSPGHRSISVAHSSLCRVEEKVGKNDICVYSHAWQQEPYT